MLRNEAPVLANFIQQNRDAIIARTRERVSVRASPSPTDTELKNGIPVFLDQLSSALKRETFSDVVDHADIGRSAAAHGHDLLGMGLTIGQVVHDYGDVCQAITELAVEQHEPIVGGEFKTLNLCLDDAIAGAVTAYARQRERTIEAKGTERLGTLAHELRNLLNSAMMAFEIIGRGQVAIGGSTSKVLGRTLLGLRDLVDRSLADVRLDAGIERVELISAAELVDEVEVGAALQARARGVQFERGDVDRTLVVEGDRQILAAAIANLLQNAIKFTAVQGDVSLRVTGSGDRVLVEVEDGCGGLPPGKADELFLPFQQRGDDRTGLGLGLTICRKAAEASAGKLSVRDLPGKGCIFTLDLPRKSPPPLVAVGGSKRG